MAIKNTRLGGADFPTPTVRVKPTDLNDTFNAVAYRNISSNTTPVIVSTSRSGSSGSGTTTDNDTITVSIGAGEIARFIHINANLFSNGKSFAASGGDVDSNTQYKIQKEYLAVTTDLMSLRTFILTDAADSGGIVTDTDRNEVYSNFYYEPTEDEKTNGFIIKIYMESNSTTNADTGSNSSASITADRIIIMGA